MKKFVFTLQRLYEVKQTEEEQKRVELDTLNGEMEALIRERDRLEDRFETQKARYNEQVQKGINKIDLKNYGDYFEYLNDEMAAQNERIADCEKRIGKCRRELLRLMNEQKVMDRIRAEQLAEYSVELQKDNEKGIEDYMQGRL